MITHPRVLPAEAPTRSMEEIPMKYLRAGAIALVLAFLTLPAAPLGGMLPIPMVGGEAHAADVPTDDPVADWIPTCDEGAGGNVGFKGGIFGISGSACATPNPNSCSVLIGMYGGPSAAHAMADGSCGITIPVCVEVCVDIETPLGTWRQCVENC